MFSQAENSNRKKGLTLNNDFYVLTILIVVVVSCTLSCYSDSWKFIFFLSLSLSFSFSLSYYEIQLEMILRFSLRLNNLCKLLISILLFRTFFSLSLLLNNYCCTLIVIKIFRLLLLVIISCFSLPFIILVFVHRFVDSVDYLNHDKHLKSIYHQVD